MSENSLPEAGRLLKNMPFFLNERKAGNSSITYGFRLSGDDGGEYSLVIKNGRCEFCEGIVENPTTLIEAPARLWVDISSGKIKPFKAMRSGMKVKGSMLAMMRFNGLFSGDPDASIVPDGLYAETENETDLKKGIWKPAKRILVIQASPRKEEGATERTLASLLKGIKSAGAAVEVVYLSDLVINPCTGCYACWKGDAGQCVIKDDMASLLERVTACDLLITATPLYTSSIPGILKNFFDCSIPLAHPYIFNRKGRSRHPSRQRRMPNLVLLSVCGFYELENFQPLVEQIGAIGENMHAPLVATLLRPHAMILCGRTHFEVMDRIHAALEVAGSELVIRGIVSKNVGKAISQPIIPRPMYMAACKQWWKEDY